MHLLSTGLVILALVSFNICYAEQQHQRLRRQSKGFHGWGWGQNGGDNFPNNWKFNDDNWDNDDSYEAPTTPPPTAAPQVIYIYSSANGLTTNNLLLGSMIVAAIVRMMRF